MASNTCGRLHPPMASAASNGISFGAQQQWLAYNGEKTMVVIDYSPGPDSVSKVVRKRTLSMMEVQGHDVSRRDAGPHECPKFSQPKPMGFTNERHSCKPIVAMGSEGVVGSKQRDVSRAKSGMQSQCAMQHEEDVQMTEPLPVQQSDHRCRRVTPGQECKPKPKTKTCIFPQLTLALMAAEPNLPFPKVDRQRCKQHKSGKRGIARHSSSTNFPLFEEGKAKKNRRVSFANEAEEDVTAVYTRCDPKWQERLARDKAKSGRKAAAEDDNSRDQGKQEVGERQPRCRKDLRAKAEVQSTSTKPSSAQQLMKDQKARQQLQPALTSRPSKGDLHEAQQDAPQRVRLNELQKCLCLYDTDHPQQTNAGEEQTETSSEEVQHQKKECTEYKTMKENPRTRRDMYQQESSGDSNESEQKEQQCAGSSQEDQKPSEPNRVACQDAVNPHVCDGQIYSGLNHVEFETNPDDEDDQMQDRQNDQRRCTESQFVAELEINRAGQTETQYRSEHGPLMAQPKRDSEDYSLQIGVIDNSKAEGVAENKRSQASRHSCQDVSRQYVHRYSSQQQSQLRTTQRPLQRQSRAQKPSCVGFQSSGAERRRRSESDPCIQRDRRNSGQQPEPGDRNEQKMWKRDDCKDLPQPQVANRSTMQSDQKRPKELPSISDSCQEALRQDAERRKRREQVERARETALQETLKPKREVARAAQASGGKASQTEQANPEVRCHCSLHSEQSCDGPVKKQLIVQLAASETDSKKKQLRKEKPCSEDAGNVEWVREGHLLVKITNGKPSGDKVVSKSGKSDIYNSGEHPRSFGDASDKGPADEEETMEESSMYAGISPSDSNDLSWHGGGMGENSTETTDDAGDPVSGSKKKCCC